MSKLWLTADKHHGHINILSYENRPFKNVEEMDKKIIQFHNEMVKEDDLTIDVGDFYFRGSWQAKKNHYWDYLKQYNGRYIIVNGNHEKKNSIIDPFQSATAIISKLRVLFVHDPINATTNYDLIVHGHLHSKSFLMELHEKGKKVLLINVGIDVLQWKFRPVPWTKLYEIYQQWKVGKFPDIYQYDKEKVKEFRKNRRQQ